MYNYEFVCYVIGRGGGGSVGKCIIMNLCIFIWEGSLLKNV